LPTRLTPNELKRFRVCPVECPKLSERISTLADYFAIIASVIGSDAPFWFRGHCEARYSLTPTALRYSPIAKRVRAIELMSEFRRIADIKLRRPPDPQDHLKWAQIGQHYGLPTRLLDWTESATAALYFACQRPVHDGIVFLLNPIELNRLSYPLKARVLDPEEDSGLILSYLKSSVRETKRGKFPVAVNPVWNSDRLMVQRGKFTLHGSRFTLDRGGVPSLVALCVLRESKIRLLSELERVGVDEMMLFPELEHACVHLKRHSGLEAP